jgi:hypothetical protein
MLDDQEQICCLVISKTRRATGTDVSERHMEFCPFCPLLLYMYKNTSLLFTSSSHNNVRRFLWHKGVTKGQ